MKRLRWLLWIAVLGAVGQSQEAEPTLRAQVLGWAEAGRAVGVLAPLSAADDRQVLLARGSVDAAGRLTLPLPRPDRLAGQLVSLKEWLLPVNPADCAQYEGQIVFNAPDAAVFPLRELLVAPAGTQWPSLGSVVGEHLWGDAQRLNSEVNVLDGVPDAAAQVRDYRLVYLPEAVTVRGSSRCVPEAGLTELLTVDLALPAGWSLVQQDDDYSGEDLRRRLSRAPADTVSLWQLP
ncbi:hypothetical protein [Deinococcus aquaedulcis]|uniref:hypothetical protein n=1 Tax=Deinococcus aquaedulcis TaxID=2840455 RepID=UPI001C838B38|nr:hypothetical protein [Deinococcus aquaedulcis]